MSKLFAIKSYYDAELGQLVTLDDDVLSIVRQVRELYGDKVAINLDPRTGWYHVTEHCSDGTERLILSTDELDGRILRRIMEADSEWHGYKDPYDAAEREQDEAQAAIDAQYWEQTSDPFHIDPGAAYVPLWPLTSGELPYFRSLDKVYITTAQYAGKLEPLSDDDFTDQWLSQDLTQVAARGTPSWYMVWNQLLYILPPPSVPMDFIAHYTRRIAPMTHTTPGTTDVPITPPHLDEAILLAAKVRCHTRAQELSLAATANAELMDVFDDMADDDTEIMDEQLDRVSPDDTWL